MSTPMGERIRKRRKEKGLTLDQLATKAECSKSYVWELENRDPPRPSAEKLSAIAAVLETTVDFLIGTPVNRKNDLTHEEIVFFRKFRGLPPRRRRDLHAMLDALEKK